MSRVAILGEGKKRLRLAACLVLAALGGCGSKMTDTSGATASPTQSSVTVAPERVLANGIETATITVVIRRSTGNPIAGRTVVLTATGSNNTIVQPADTDQNGTTTGTIASTTAETKTITVAVLQGSHTIELAQHPDVEFFEGAQNISPALSTATASPAALVADGVAASTITVTVRDTNGNPVAGQAVQLSSSGSNNTLVQPAVSDVSGVATGTIASTTAETKTITATVNPGAGQVVIAQQPAVVFAGDPNNLSAALSTATASPSTNVVANGSTTSTITVTVRDGNGNAVAGQSVVLASTGSNNTLVQPGVTDAGGVATGTIATTTAATKTITVTLNPGASQVVLTQQPTVTFVGDPNNISAALSSATASPGTNVVANGVTTSTITVTVRDGNGNAVAGQSVALASTGGNNTLVQPGITNASGVATGTIATTTAETKTVTVTVDPGASQVVVAQQPTVVFVGDPNNISAALSTAVAWPTTNVVANGIATSLIAVTVRDVHGNAVAGQSVALASTGSNNTLVQPGVTNAYGMTTGSIASIRAEAKTITATVNPGASQVVVAQNPAVTFVGDPNNLSAALSTAVASPQTGVVANGITTSTITVTVRDGNGNAVAGQSVALASTGGNNTLVQPGITNASGIANGTIVTTTAETKTVTATVNPGASQVVVAQQPTVVFVGDPNNLSAALSTATASPSTNVVANGSTTSTITVTVRDVNGNAVAGQSVALASTGSNNTLVQPGVTSASGVATGTIATTTAESKTITVTLNPGPGQMVVSQQPTVGFVGDPNNISAGLSTAAAWPITDVVADGVATSTITVTVRDVHGNVVAGQSVVLASTGTNNTFVQPGVTNAGGVTTGTMASIRAETKTITVTVNPGSNQVVVAQHPGVVFVGDPDNISAALSTATAAPDAGVVANGVTASTITVTVRDVNGNAVAGQIVDLASTGSNNTFAQPGVTDSNGVATGTIASIRAETKTITATVNPGQSQVVVGQQPSVGFVGDPENLSAVLSTATASPDTGVVADGVATSTVAVTVRAVHMDMTAHPAKITPSRGGHSIGRWDGDTLVVDTIGFAPGSISGNLPHSDKLHVVERFTLNPTTLELTRGIVAEDPLYWADKYVDTDSVLAADTPFRVEACKELAPEYQQPARK